MSALPRAGPRAAADSPPQTPSRSAEEGGPGPHQRARGAQGGGHVEAAEGPARADGQKHEGPRWRQATAGGRDAASRAGRQQGHALERAPGVGGGAGRGGQQGERRCREEAAGVRGQQREERAIWVSDGDPAEKGLFRVCVRLCMGSIFSFFSLVWEPGRSFSASTAPSPRQKSRASLCVHFVLQYYRQDGRGIAALVLMFRRKYSTPPTQHPSLGRCQQAAFLPGHVKPTLAPQVANRRSVRPLAQRRGCGTGAVEEHGDGSGRAPVRHSCRNHEHCRTERQGPGAQAAGLLRELPGREHHVQVREAGREARRARASCREEG